MTELYSDHLEWTQEGLQLDRLVDMKERGLRPEVQDVKIVPSSSDNGAYLVAKIDVLDVPFERADLAADTVEDVYVCSCSDFYFNQSDGIEADRKPSDMGRCKHQTAAYKTVRAANDDSQTGLDEL